MLRELTECFLLFYYYFLGRRSDICYRSKPCLNGGSCLQISSDPGFKCRCEGTGYYGPHCDKR